MILIVPHTVLYTLVSIFSALVKCHYCEDLEWLVSVCIRWKNLHDVQESWKFYVISWFFIISFEMIFDFLFRRIRPKWSHHSDDVTSSDSIRVLIRNNIIYFLEFVKCFFLFENQNLSLSFRSYKLKHSLNSSICFWDRYRAILYI